MRSTRFAVAATTGVLVLAAAATSAGAAGDVTVNAGALGVTTSPTVGDFGAVTLDGTERTTTAAVSGFRVTDARGTGDGWNLTVQATRFAEIDGMGGSYVGGTPKQLDTGILTLSTPSVAKHDVTSSGTPSSQAITALDGAGAQTLYQAAAGGDGMGSYDFGTSTLTLQVPASSYAGFYRSDVTVTVATLP